MFLGFTRHGWEKTKCYHVDIHLNTEYLIRFDYFSTLSLEFPLKTKFVRVNIVTCI